jgi:hypothetical protein
MYIARLMNRWRIWFTCSFLALMLALVGLLALNPLSAQAATFQTATTAQPASYEVTITHIQRISARVVRITFNSDHDYTGYALRYSDNGGNWHVIWLGHPAWSHVIVVNVNVYRAYRHHFVLEVCGVNGHSYQPWSGSYDWDDD